MRNNWFASSDMHGCKSKKTPAQLFFIQYIVFLNQIAYNLWA